MDRLPRSRRWAIVLAVLAPGVALAFPPFSTGFTYQGRLLDNGIPVDGPAAADLRFRVWDASVGGAPVTGTITHLGVSFDQGLFTRELNFGVNVFDGNDRWLEIQAAVPAGGAFVTLAPRQRMSPTPYALQTRGLFVDGILNAGVGTTSPLAKLDVADGDMVVSRAGTTQIQLDGVDAGGFAVGPDLDMFSGGALGMELTTVPEGTLGRSFNTTTGALASAFGTSNLNDGTGFINVRNRASTTTVQLWADADGIDDGDAEGQMKVRSTGGGPGGEVMVQNDSGTETVELLGGGTGLSGTVRMYDAATGNDTVGADGGNTGGRLYTGSEDGFRQATIEPDVNGEGVFVSLRRTNGSTGLSFDGNFGGTGNPSLNISGTASSATINTNSTGNSAVSLATDAISAVEILDEPGVASDHLLGPIAGAGFTNITSRSITVPAAGYVLVMGTCEASRSHTNGSTSSMWIGVSDVSLTLPTDQDFEWVLPSTAPTGSYDATITAHGLFDVAAAGTFTYYFVMNNTSVAGSYVINDTQFTLVYFPTAYGTVDPTLPALRGDYDAENDPSLDRAPLTPEDIEAERADAVLFDQQRRATEMAQMKAELAALQQRLEQLEREQAAARPAETPTRETASAIDPGTAPAEANAAQIGG